MIDKNKGLGSYLDVKNGTSNGDWTPKPYNGNNFNDWFKKMYGVDYNDQGFTRKDGMSDTDWSTGNTLYNYYLSGNNLAEKYKASQGVLDSNKRNAQQNASISYDKLQKYLPMQMKAQGLGGLGVSESAMLQANNNYNNTMGQIAGDYGSQLATLQSAYGTDKANLELDKNNSLTEIQEKYMEQQREDGNWVGDHFLEEIGGKTYTEAKEQYDSIKSSVPEYMRTSIENELATMKKVEAEEKQAEEDAKQTETDAKIIAGEKTFEYDGNTYMIKKKIEIGKEGVLKMAGFKHALETTYGTRNLYDGKLKNWGTVHFNNEDYTYYNGNWYTSKRVG